MSHRPRMSLLAALFFAVAMALISASATEAKSTGGPIDVPASWGPQALGWGDLASFRSSTRRASCVALEHDGWTVLANLGWLHRLVVASPHGDNSVASKARAHLLAHWALFRRDARALIRAGEACPKTLAGRERLAAKIAGTPSGEQAPGWAHRMFELFAVLYPHSASESCALLTPKIAAAQKDLASGPAQAKYFGRTRMTTHPQRWLAILKTGSACIVHTGDGMEAGVAFGLPTLLGAARAERVHDRGALSRLRAFFK